MNRILCSTFLLTVLLSATCTQVPYNQKLDCFSIIAGKNATEDGSVIIAHNEDTGIRITNYYKVKAKNYKDGEIIKLHKGAYLSQVERTASYIWMNLPGIDVCDSYLNEYGVCIASDGCPSREDKPEITDGGILYRLRMIMAERATSARDAIMIAAELIDRFGYDDSGRSYLIGDANEGWMMSVVHGKHWVAKRVPDNEVAVMPNYFTIGELDLSDTLNYLGSPDLIEYAVKRGWYNPDTDGEFHFARAYADPGSLTHPGNYKRMWRGVSLLSGKEFDMKGKFEFSFIPEKLLSLKDIMTILRDHYEGTELDRSELYTKGNPYKMNGPTICAEGTQYSFVAQMRNWLPNEIGSLMWIAPYRPDMQVFIPFYAGIKSVPEPFSYKDSDFAVEHHHNPEEDTFSRRNGHAFWDFVLLAEKVDENYLELGKVVKEKQRAFEDQLIDRQHNVEDGIYKVMQDDPDRGLELLTNYSNGMALKAHSLAIELLEILSK